VRDLSLNRIFGFDVASAVLRRLFQRRSTNRASASRNRSRLTGLRLLWPGLLAASVLLASFAPGHAGSIDRLGQGEILAKVARARGRVVLMNFWATWCSSCVKEVRVLSGLRKDYPRESLLLLGISMDDSESSLSRFLEEHKPGYPVYLAGRGVASSFQVSGVPKTIIYNQEGRRVHSSHGFVSAKELRRIVDRVLDHGSAGSQQ